MPEHILLKRLDQFAATANVYLDTTKLTFLLSCINIIHYFKVFYACLRAVENTHLIKLNQFITPMNSYPYAKKHVHTLSLSDIS